MDMKFTLILSLILIANAASFAQTRTARNWELAIEGNKAFTEGELIRTSEKCLLADSRWNAIQSAETLDYCLWKLRMFLRSKGYLQAKVDFRKKETIENGVRFIVGVAEGSIYRLREITVKGARALSSVDILGRLPLKAGDIADGEAVSKWLFESVKEAYSELGYIQYTAEVEPIFRVEPGAIQGTVDLAITIDEGRRFYVHAIKIDGNGDVPKALLTAQLLIQAGDVYNSELLRQSLKRIDQTKQFEAIDPDKDLDFRSKQNSDQVDITIHLKKVYQP